MGDLWDDISNAPPDDVERERVHLPVGAWGLFATATGENGKAAPGLRKIEPKSGGDPFWLFEVGLFCIGGAEKFEEKKHTRSALFYSSSLNNKEEPTQLAGRLTSFLNACFAPGVGDEFLVTEGTKDEKQAGEKKRSAARWQKTVAVLQAASQEHNVNFGDYDSRPMFLSACGVAALLPKAQRVLVKTGSRPYKSKDGEAKVEVTAATVADATVENLTKRAVNDWNEVAF